MLFVLFAIAGSALVKSETTPFRSSLLERLGNRAANAKMGMLPRADHATVWHDDTCIDAFGIGADLGETRRAGVRGMLPSAEPRTVWESANGIDAFSVFVEEKEDEMEYDPASDFTMGRLPRSEHGTTWRSTDTLDAYSVFTGDDAAPNDAEEEEEEEHILGQLPTIA